MTTYVALLRGIAPMNPNMQSKKLKKAFGDLGFTNVRTVISSGNVVFESASKNTKAMETKAEKYFPKHLGFKSTTIIRSQTELEKLAKRNPFKSKTMSPKTYLIVTFLKNGKKDICAVVDTTNSKTPDYMRETEKKYGKEITTRTWKTVGRILKKMDSSLAF